MKILAGRVGLRSGWGGVARAAVAAGLCVVLVEQPLWAAAAPQKVRAERQAADAGLTGEARTLHALNRLTFGPRPGEVAAVQAMGLERWFAQQLNPASIDDAALDAKLAQFPAMFLPQEELMHRFPSPQVLRQMIRKNDALPSDPVEHAIYADQIAFYKAARAKQEAANADGSMAEGKAGKKGGRPAPIASPGDGNGNGGEMAAGNGAAAMDGAGEMAMEADAAKDGKDTKGQKGGDFDAPAPVNHVERLYPAQDVAQLVGLAPQDRIRRILGMSPQELKDFSRSLSQRERVAVADGLNPEQKEILAALRGSPRLIGGEVLQSRILRDVYSNRQLEAVMTDFWLNHFNVYVRKNGNEAFLLPAYEREVIRPNALGRFEDLLVGTAKSPAMLMYLDNFQSIGPDSQAATNGKRFAGFAKNPQVKQALKDRGLNENYARELMELHTVGVGCEVSQDHPASALDKACGPGYTQADVTQVAKVLSGWTIDRPFAGASYRFEERRHEPGSKHVLGQKISEGGEREGMQVLHMLATSPATAKFISTKLAVRFVSDTPPPALVEAMAKTFVASGGDIKAVLTTMFHAPEFWSPEVNRAKVKTPLEFVASAVRATDADVVNAQPLVASLDKLGMPLYGMQTPNGYSWVAGPWVSTGALVTRMNFALVLTGDKLPGVKTDWGRVLGGPGGSAEVSAGEASAAGKEQRLERVLMGQAVSERTRATVLRQFADPATHAQAEADFALRPGGGEVVDGEVRRGRAGRGSSDPQVAGMAGLLLGSPEFQRR